LKRSPLPGVIDFSLDYDIKFFLDVIRRAFRNTKLVKGMNLLRATNNMVDKIEDVIEEDDESKQENWGAGGPIMCVSPFTTSLSYLRVDRPTHESPN
jgi:hypothetical protein